MLRGTLRAGEVLARGPLSTLICVYLRGGMLRPVAPTGPHFEVVCAGFFVRPFLAAFAFFAGFASAVCSLAFRASAQRFF